MKGIYIILKLTIKYFKFNSQQSKINKNLYEKLIVFLGISYFKNFL